MKVNIFTCYFHDFQWHHFLFERSPPFQFCCVTFAIVITVFQIQVAWRSQTRQTLPSYNALYTNLSARWAHYVVLPSAVFFQVILSKFLFIYHQVQLITFVIYTKRRELLQFRFRFILNSSLHLKAKPEHFRPSV